MARWRKNAVSLSDDGTIGAGTQDLFHPLSDEVLRKYAFQIEYLEAFGSGVSLFQTYRQAKVLAVGSGTFLISLISALFDSGLTKFHVLITDSEPTDRQRLDELVEHARKTDPEAAIKEIRLMGKGLSSWRQTVQPFQSILYVSQTGDVEELQTVHTVCKDEKKVFLPALCVRQAGFAGPLVRPGSEGCWESAWRRIHRSALHKDPVLRTFSRSSCAMLANVIVFELLKTVTGETELSNAIFLLDLQTLEGNLHPFLPHPLITGCASPEPVHEIHSRLTESRGIGDPNELLSYFSRVASEVSGIFHIWDEGDLRQLPLSLCRVQAADPLSVGPAEMLQEIVCSGLTHMEARREAGLAGIEAYVSRLAGLFDTAQIRDQEPTESMYDPQAFVGIGAGGTAAEGLCRGLQKCLAHELEKRMSDLATPFFPAQLSRIEDERCRFFLRALTTMQGVPAIGVGEELSGFPVAWVGTGGRWYGCVGLSMTTALRMALQQALLKAQNQAACLIVQGLEIPSVLLEENEPLSLEIPASDEGAHEELFKSALQVLKRSGRRPLVFDMALEPFLKEGLAGVFGIQLREEEPG